MDKMQVEEMRKIWDNVRTTISEAVAEVKKNSYKTYFFG